MRISHGITLRNFGRAGGHHYSTVKSDDIMATVLVTSDRDHVPSAAEVSIKGADEAKNTFALKKTSRAARVLNPESIWDETALLEALRADGIKDLHAWTIWKHLIRASDPATVNFEVCVARWCVCAAASKCQTNSKLDRVHPVKGSCRSVCSSSDRYLTCATVRDPFRI